MLASFAGDPARITRTQMDERCRQSDNNWAFCDGMCFNGLASIEKAAGYGRNFVMMDTP